MSGIDGGQRRDQLGLTPDDETTYRAIAAGEDVTADTDLTRLLASGLIDHNPYTAGQFIALDPRAVIQRVLAAEQDAVEASLARMSALPVLEGLSPAYERNRRFDGMGSEFLPTKSQMNDRIGEVTGRSDVELLAAQPAEPVDRDPATHRLGTERSLAALQRGASLRLLYRASAAGHRQTREYVAALIEAGGEVRAVAGHFPRMVIVDRKSLFIDDHVTGTPEVHAGWHVADRSSVMWARSVFDHLWDSARPWPQAVAAAGEVVLTDRQMDILGQLYAGRVQADAGRALGISDRIVSSNLFDAREQLGLDTTFQLMAWYGRWLERQEA